MIGWELLVTSSSGSCSNSDLFLFSSNNIWLTVLRSAKEASFETLSFIFSTKMICVDYSFKMNAGSKF